MSKGFRETFKEAGVKQSGSIGQLMEFPLEILQGSIDILLKALPKRTLVNMLILLTVEGNRDFEALVEDLRYWKGVFEREVFLEETRLNAENDESSRIFH